jgi:hypothetical protein
VAALSFALAGCGSAGLFPEKFVPSWSTGELSDRARVHALFDLDSPSIGPFPSDQFTVPDETQITGLRVALPRPDCAERPSDCEDLDVINTLDGFNLQPRLTISFDSPIDVGTVNSSNVLLVEFGNHRRPRTIGIDQIVWDPGTNRLYVESDQALAQHARFALIVTRGVRDASGSPVAASQSFHEFMSFGSGRYHEALTEGVRAARHAGIHQHEIVTAAVFTTLSSSAVLEKIRDQIKADVPAPASFVYAGIRTVFPRESVRSIRVHQQTRVSPPGFTDSDVTMDLFDFVRGAVGTLALGHFLSPNYETPDKYIPAVGTLTGTPVPLSMEELGFDLVLPSGPAPATGWPVAIWNHGGGASKESIAFFAAKMAQHGLATIAINAVGHGFGPLSTLEITLSDGDQIVFPAGGRGVDINGDNVIDDKEGFDTVPPFAIITDRDGRRQTIADTLQLVREIEVGMDVDGDGKPDLDPSRIYYFGQSNGGINGITFLAVEPSVLAGVANVPGGSRVEFRRLSPVSRQNNGDLLAQRIPSLLNPPGLIELEGVPLMPPFFHENKPLRNGAPLAFHLADGTSRVVRSPVINDVPGAIEIQTAFENQEWVNEPADPVVYSPHLRSEPLPGVPRKSVIIQFAKTDQNDPNPATTRLVQSGDLADVATYFRNDLAYAERSGVPKNPHTFIFRILNPVVSDIAVGAQEQIATFFETDGAAIIHPEPARFFEVPIVPPLPEYLEFIP